MGKIVIIFVHHVIIYVLTYVKHNNQARCKTSSFVLSAAYLFDTDYHHFIKIFIPAFSVCIYLFVYASFVSYQIILEGRDFEQFCIFTLRK